MRAASDRLIFDVATVKYLVSAMRKNDFERRCKALDWTVRQTIGHLALSLETAAAALPELLAADPGADNAPPDWDALNADMARETATMPIGDIMETLARARDASIAAFLPLSEADLARPVTASVTVGDIIESWGSHFDLHAIDLVDAIPRLRFDPLLLNWVLYADYSRNPDLLARQQRLLADVREHYAEEEDDHES
jgi:hypothetical protein